MTTDISTLDHLAMDFDPLPPPDAFEPQCWSCLQSTVHRGMELNGVGQLPWCHDCWDRIPPAQRITLMQSYLKFLQDCGSEVAQRKEDMHHAVIHLVRMAIAKLMATPDEGSGMFNFHTRNCSLPFPLRTLLCRHGQLVLQAALFVVALAATLSAGLVDGNRHAGHRPTREHLGQSLRGAFEVPGGVGDGGVHGMYQ
ncbi:hypothetical protein Spb1_24260 [Planctopirus ephydatiae]|uniref:Uncharacterized protein n=1 Tax=Planctopirus ephydatiae TaxID=2528019 RepID=A0A518GPE4_9PLAN|nr:hypothetical protein [Planctopirus ephydatiae]QDV30492.1 hypothetical protein Spb1_24260 [Planctopirus ephydatiae]